MSSVLLVYSKFEYEKWKSNPKTVKQFKYEKISPNKEKYNYYLEKNIRKPITNDAVNGGSGRQKQHHPCGGTITFHSLAVKCVYYHMWNTSPVQVRHMKQGTQSRCTGTTQRDGVGREVRGGFGMGDTCTPVADSCQWMAKTITKL